MPHKTGTFPPVWAATLALALAGLVACDVGSGAGEVKGDIFIDGCNGAQGWGTAEMPRAFSLDPTFFAGDPIADVAVAGKVNQLQIRLQRVGGRQEDIDALLIIVRDQFEVARCLRGESVTDGSGVTVPAYDTSFCHWPTPAGPARMRVGVNSLISVSFLPNNTCKRSIVGTAVGCEETNGCENTPPEQWLSWIEFDRFGRATSEDKIDKDFSVTFDERIRASRFRLTLVDSQFLHFGVMDFPIGMPRREMGGVLTGWFDFDMQRGRGLQTFP